MVSLVDDIADGDGDLTKRLESRSWDELGALARGINRFIDKLQALLGDVQKTASEVHRHAGDTDRIAGQTDNNLQHHQAEMEQMLTAVQEMSYVSQEVATHANNTADSAKHRTHPLPQHIQKFLQKTLLIWFWDLFLLQPCKPVKATASLPRLCVPISTFTPSRMQS